MNVETATDQSLRFCAEDNGLDLYERFQAAYELWQRSDKKLEYIEDNHRDFMSDINILSDASKMFLSWWGTVDEVPWNDCLETCGHVAARIQAALLESEGITQQDIAETLFPKPEESR